jgi:hypothetical protein
MQLSTIRSEVRTAAGFDANDANASDTQLNSLINRALRNINGMRDWDWRKASETINTVVDQQEYARNSRAARTVRVEDVEQGYTLLMSTPSNTTRYQDFRGRPAFWYVEAGQLVLTPKPSEVRAIKHVYLRSELTLSGDTDEPMVPDDAIDMVIVQAAVYLLDRTDDTSQRRLLKDQLDELIDTQDKNTRRAKGSPVVHTRRDWFRPGRGV